MLRADHQLNKQKNGESSPWWAPPPGKKLAKEGKCFRQTTN